MEFEADFITFSNNASGFCVEQSVRSFANGLIIEISHTSSGNFPSSLGL
ncbi:hypothetical protein HMPREF3232_00216 [Fannyhessea vaginae]|nr:hypothetical protein HMPREF3232_00216 [Fannyhessea vaginae]